MRPPFRPRPAIPCRERFHASALQARPPLAAKEPPPEKEPLGRPVQPAVRHNRQKK
jgi:hypothetical protein